MQDFLTELRRASIVRQQEWTGDKVVSMEFRLIEFVGEVGELCNKIKKWLREAMGAVGTRTTLEEIADEMGDAQITLDLLAQKFDINLGEVTRAKFNKTSDKYGLKTKL